MYDDLPSGGEFAVYGTVIFTYVFKVCLTYTLVISIFLNFELPLIFHLTKLVTVQVWTLHIIFIKT